MSEVLESNITVIVTLNSGMGSGLGPNFDITANVGTVSPSTATKAELLAGKTFTVNGLATQITITSTGTCTNFITLSISGLPTTTTTTSTTTTTTTTTTTAAPTTTTTTAAPTTTTTTAAPTTTTTTEAPTTTTTTTTAAPPPTFQVSVNTSSGGVCLLQTIRTVYASNNAISLSDAAADNAILYRMPQNVVLVGYTYVAEYEAATTSIVSETFNLNSSTGQIGSGTGDFC
jgi:hypothetical protein